MALFKMIENMLHFWKEIWNADVMGGGIEMMMVADGRGSGVKNLKKTADVINGLPQGAYWP